MDYVKGNPLRLAVWLAALLGMAVIAGLLVKWEPMISEAVFLSWKGKWRESLNQKWYRILPAKFIGGFFCMFGGLALGREGPSIQLGAMMGKRDFADPRQRKNRRKVSADLRSQRGNGRRHSRLLLRALCLLWRRYIKILRQQSLFLP